jgi:hypothetical protein
MILQRIIIQPHGLHARQKSNGLGHKTTTRGNDNFVVYPRLKYQLELRRTYTMTNNTYTVAIITDFGPHVFDGLPCNMTLAQAESLAKQARAMGRNAVAYNTNAA